MTSHPNAGRAPEDDHKDVQARRWAYWRRVCDGLPPMTGQEIAAVGAILRRIDRQQQDTPRPDEDPGS